MQNTLNIVNGSLPRPKEDSKSDGLVTQSTDYSKGYNPKEVVANWDALSELACATICLTLSRPLALRYQKTKPASRLFTTIVNAHKKNTRAWRIRLQEVFWESKHDPNTLISLLIGHVRVAADELLTINELPTDRQIADRLVAGLDNSWSAVKDSIIYTAQEMSLAPWKPMKSVSMGKRRPTLLQPLSPHPNDSDAPTAASKATSHPIVENPRQRPVQYQQLSLVATTPVHLTTEMKSMSCTSNRT
ncbi:hypothetical protein PGT21_028462 [Puccinia graminis f. sp. tritici]|uniref:Uncharacterized protein n=1 Tax=Puccinia graminis f. sp. tritici TaxID=56615 RepID=A0A5B0M805_PUCGR|nr:hypothetical protein PGT21_028462 [Puccinia graminis f. sp. tritici]